MALLASGGEAQTAPPRPGTQAMRELSGAFVELVRHVSPGMV